MVVDFVFYVLMLIAFQLQMYEWDSKNVILTGSKDGVVRVCRNYFTIIMNYRKLIFFLNIWNFMYMSVQLYNKLSI